jgi:FkbM family methyltransferase
MKKVSQRSYSYWCSRCVVVAEIRCKGTAGAEFGVEYQLRGIIDRVLLQFRYVNLGLAATDKLRIFIANFLRLIFRPFGTRSLTYRNFIRNSRRIISNVTIEVEGNLYRVYDFDSLTILSPHFEPFVEHWFMPSTGDIILDIGAHIGKYTVPAAKKVGNLGKVVAIEPNATNYRLLVENIRLNKVSNVIPLNLAAWRESTELKLYHGDMSGHHSAKTDWSLGYDMVPARPVGNVLAELGLSHVDWVKIDAEGSEVEVLEGMSEVLPFCTNVIIEANLGNIRSVKKFSAMSGHAIIQISPLLVDAAYFLLTRGSS